MINGDNIEKYMVKYGNHVKVISTIAIIITSVIAIGGGYIWYRSNLWKPKVEVINVDFEKAIAQLLVNGKEKTLYGNSILAAGGEWGVRFGTTDLSMYNTYDSIELVKNNMVYNIYTTNKKR